MVKFFYIVVCLLFVSACDAGQYLDEAKRITNNSRNDVIDNLLNSLDPKTKKAVNACVKNWSEVTGERDIFWQMIGSLGSYDNYIVLEFGNTEDILYRGLFLGMKNNKWYLHSSKESEVIYGPDINFEYFFGKLLELKREKFKESMWPTPCKIISIKADSLERELVSFSMLNLLNYEMIKDLELDISTLDQLMIELERELKKNESTRQSTQ